MPVRVQLPSGQTAEFPDGMDPAHISAEIESHLGQFAAGSHTSAGDPGAPNPVVADNQGTVERAINDRFANNSVPGSEALRPVGNAGRRLTRNLVSVASHPVDTVAGIGKQALELADYTPPDSGFSQSHSHPLRDQLHQYGQTLQQDPMQAASDVAGDAATGYVLGKVGGAALEHAPDVLNATGRSLKKGGALVDRVTVGAPSPSEPGVYNADIGRGLSQQRVIGTSMRSLRNKVSAKVGPAAETRDAILSRSTAGPSDIAAAIDDPFRDIAADKTDPRTGAVQPGGIRRLSTTRRAIQEVQDPDSGSPTGTPKDTNLQPAEIGKLQRNVYDMTDYSTPESDLSNQALKGAASNLRTRLRTVAPEANTMTDTVHDLLGAEDHLKQRVGAPPSSTDLAPGKVTGKLVDRARLGLGTATGAALDYLGSGLQSASGLLRRAGRAASPSPVASGSPSSSLSSRMALPGPGQSSAAPVQNFPSRVVPPSSPAAAEAISGVPVPPVTTVPPPVNPAGYLPESTTASTAPSPLRSRVQPALNEDTARMRVNPRGVAHPDSEEGTPTITSPSRRLIATPDGIRPEPLPLGPGEQTPLLEARTGDRAPSQRASLIAQLQQEAAKAGRNGQLAIARSVKKLKGVPEATNPPAAPAIPEAVPPAPVPVAPRKATLASRVNGNGKSPAPSAPVTPAPKPKAGGLPAPTDIDGWESLVDQGKARYNVSSHQYEYLGGKQ